MLTKNEERSPSASINTLNMAKQSVVIFFVFLFPLFAVGLSEWMVHHFGLVWVGNKWSALLPVPFILPGMVYFFHLKIPLVSRIVLCVIHFVLYGIITSAVALFVGMIYLGL